MKQAIQEGFILDVLGSYTPVNSYYSLVKMIEDDPEFDSRKAQRKLRRYVEGHEHAIRLKAEIMVDHFHANVIGPGRSAAGARHGRNRRRSARHRLLSRHQELSERAWQSPQRHRRVLRRARVRRRERHRESR